MRNVAFHQPLESVFNPKDVHPTEATSNGGGFNDTIDAGGWSAPDQNGEFRRWGIHGVVFHANG
jgi:hypothetical protein